MEKTGKCAKCGVKLSSEEFVNLPEPGQSQIEKEEADFQRDLKCLPERRRRAFLRYLQKFNGKSSPPPHFVLYISVMFSQQVKSTRKLIQRNLERNLQIFFQNSGRMMIILTLGMTLMIWIWRMRRMKTILVIDLKYQWIELKDFSSAVL